MTEQEIRTLIVAELGKIAPETDAAAVDPGADLREALDIDFLDFLNFVEAIHKRTGVNVPERDYPSLQTVNKAVAYLLSKQKG